MEEADAAVPEEENEEVIVDEEKEDSAGNAEDIVDGGEREARRGNRGRG